MIDSGGVSQNIQWVGYSKGRKGRISLAAFAFFERFTLMGAGAGREPEWSFRALHSHCSLAQPKLL